MTIKNKLLVAAALAAAGLVFINNENIRKQVLPDGLFSFNTPTPTPSVAPQPIPGKPQVELTTTKGKIVIELRPDLAPVSAANFLAKWNSGYCEGKTFHRVEDWVVQGCDPKGDGTGGELTLPTEISSESFVTGSVGVARKITPKDKSNDSQFFIVKKDAPYLDKEYTYLGKVVSGMDTVLKLTTSDKIQQTSVLSK